MRSPVTLPGHHAGRTAPNRGKTYPVEILTEEEATALVQECSRRAPTGVRNRALIAVLYRAGLEVNPGPGQLKCCDRIQCGLRTRIFDGNAYLVLSYLVRHLIGFET